jgi:tetratricopeptide (TPR) repeat protein
MNTDWDWEAYVKITHNNFIMRYLEHTETHNQPTADHYDELEQELDNIFLAIDRARSSEAWSVIISIVYALLEGCLRVRGYWNESIECGHVLAQAGEKVGDKRAEGWAWASAIGWILVQQGQYEEGRKAIERALQAFNEAGSQWGTWSTRRFLGHAYHSAGDLETARNIYLSALQDAKTAYSTRFPTLSLLKRYIKFVRRNWHRGKWTWRAFVITRRTDYQSITTHYFNDLGNLAREQGNLKEAHRYYQQALTGFEQLGREMEIGIVLNGLAYIALKQEVWEKARRFYTQSLEINRRYKRKLSMAESYLGLAQIELAQGNTENARRLDETAKDIYQSLGVSPPVL